MVSYDVPLQVGLDVGERYREPVTVAVKLGKQMDDDLEVIRRSLRIDL